MSSPSDIICKLRNYILKERIMQRTQKRPYFDFDGAHFFLPGPVSTYFNATQGTSPPPGGITYKWRFPFTLQVKKDGKFVTLLTKDDFPYLL